MSWEDQGRQEHAWFGHGTAPTRPDDSDTADGAPESLGKRIAAVAHGAIASLPPARRRRAEAQNDAGGLARLTEAMTAWVRGSALDQAGFADRFFSRAADDPVVQTLHSAALGAALATNHAGLRDAAEELAGAMQTIGLDQWPRFLADVGQRIAQTAPGAKQSQQVAEAALAGVLSDAGPAVEAPGTAGATPAQTLQAAEEAAYDLSPNDCSHAVWELLKRTGSPEEPYRTANDFMSMVAKPDSGWRQVTVDEASRLANEGKVVIGGLAVPGDNGHILVVTPGPLRPAGGFKAGKDWILPTPDKYPPAMSGSSNNDWPGTRSRGEKTVYDAWRSKDYPKVTFWTRQL